MSTLDRDDALLDGLGLGGAAHTDDPLAGMLAAWRDDLVEPPFAPTLDLDIVEQAALADPIDLDSDDDEPPATVLRPAASGHSDASTAASHVVAAGAPASTGPAGSSRPPGRRAGPARPVRGARLRPGRMLLAAALLVAVFGGGVVLGAGAGQPGTPLWPVTQLVYAERADSRVAAQDTAELLARAERALREQRHGDAETLLRQAWDRLGEVREKSDHERLRAELTRLLTAFAADTTPTTAPLPTPTPAGSPAPSAGTATPTPGRTDRPSPSPTPASGSLLPGLLPSLPPILPSLLPDLPLL
ncbi:anti-sigma-D factor RsdA [Catellatospora aurea]|uniref:Anti-sigma-D factor RsdA n=1 Tax=Catellatospora aurea TaxID=1337874 RepID=A0ABW2GZN3_9ACTN